MRRLRLPIAAAITMALAVPIAAVPAAHGAVPEYQRVIKARSASAAVVVQEGCLETRLWVSSSANMFGGRPGRVDKQGLTSILVQRLDTCQPDEVSAAAEPPSGTVLFEGIGQTLDPLGSTPRFTRAWLQTTVPVLDEISGQTVAVGLDLTWVPLTPYDRDTVSSHARDPHGGIVNSHSQTLMADASVSGTVILGPETITVSQTTDATLEQVKYGCQLVRHPRGSTDFSC